LKTLLWAASKKYGGSQLVVGDAELGGAATLTAAEGAGVTAAATGGADVVPGRAEAAFA